MTTPLSQKNAFDWKGQPSVFAADRHHNGVNLAIAAKARANKDAKAVLPTQSINTESETPEGKRFRLRRRSQ